MIYYVVIVSAPGYLPEGDPVVIQDEQPPTEVLAYMRDHVEILADNEANSDAQTDAWDKLHAEIAQDVEHASEFDASAGFLYTLPDGYNMEATAYTRDQLLEMGYTPGEDFDS